MKKPRNRWYHELVHTGELPLNSSNRDEVLTWLYNSNLVPWYTTYLLQKPYEDDTVQDIVGELYLILSEIPQDKWDFLYEQGKFAVSGYVTGVIKFQVWSKTSSVYFKYHRHKERNIIMDDEFWTDYAEEQGI